MKTRFIKPSSGRIEIEPAPISRAQVEEKKAIGEPAPIRTSRTEAPSKLREAEARALFTEVCREQWQYYADQVNATTNHLPPDNVKVDRGTTITVDYRTSPTNIGLYLLSTVVAEKLGFIGKAEMHARLRNTIETIEKLPKHEGHLYNWYSIDGEPKEIGSGFISTVDNGNFVAFLMAIHSAIDDAKLKADLKRLIESMRFDLFYDRDKGLLHHGGYVKDGQLHRTAGHYDMIITEARCAYAAAIMLGQIPESSWRNMKRKLGKEIDNLNVNRSLDFQSYTGTMFEYLTPRLLMKHAGTPLGAADEQAVKIQMNDSAGGIWGRSEANSNTSNGYAAWGAKKLSQSKEFTGTGHDIIAPYASQMAAGIAPIAVADNLRKMEEVGLRGRYGFYESCAVTKNGSEYEYDVVPQFYAHHIGMGFVGMANHLLGDVVTDWFHGSKLGDGKKLDALLETPVSSYAQPATKKTRARVLTNAYAYEAPITYNKKEIIGNGSFVSRVLPIGSSTWVSSNYAVTHNEAFYVKDNETGAVLPMRSFEHDIDGLSIRVDVSISPTNKAKISRVEIDNKSGRDRDVSITGYLDWILDDINAYLNHPVYRNLYVETELDPSGAVIARRRTMQGPDQARQPFGFFAIAGGADWADGSRTSILGRLGSISAPRAIVEGKSGNTFGATLDPAAALSKRVAIKAGEKAEITFIAGVADRKDQIPRIIQKEKKPTKKKGVPHYPPDTSHAKMSELSLRTERALRVQSRPIHGSEKRPEEIGHFENGGRVFVVDDPFATKKPWSMVASNGSYGFVATAAGWAYSFGSNSQQDRITPYLPDNTSEAPLRGVIAKDRATGETFSIAPNPAPASNGKYRVEMSPGSIKYVFSREDGLTLSMTQFVANRDPAELWKIDVVNGSGKEADLELSSFLKWASEEAKRNSVHAIIGGESRENQLFSTKEDPFSGLTTDLKVAPGETKTISFLLGKGGRELVDRFDSIERVNAELAIQEKDIASKLDSLKVSTPDTAFDTMLNTWLPYQAYYAHYLARSGYYQSGGAYGFRDQLQTVMNLLDTGNPHFREVAKKHIVESTRHQFEDGSVQHWWHPHNNLGQRSTISDNLLWLPFALSHYLEVTGDRSILAEQTPFTVARELKEGELDFCEPMPFSEHTASVYEHAKRAIDLVIEKRMGEHGLPLIGKGDWNDGLDRVGHLGKGESVWNAFFLHDVLLKFAAIAEKENDRETAERYRAEASKLRESIDRHAWNGEHYIRAYADSGEKIDFNDAIVQAWAVSSGAADPEKAKRAIASAVKSLYKPESKTILLFDRTLHDEPWGGSLAAYPNGLRENNAQYTHGSSWLPRAVAELGDGDLAMELYHCLLPTVHASDPRYGAEPYVVAADIYGGDKAGEGGWTWYSGGPGWIYRTGVEKILGLQFRDGDRLFIDPCIPTKWPGFTVTHNNHRIVVKNPDGVSKGVKSIRVDGRSIDPKAGIRLVDDGKTHEIEVIMGATDRSAPTRRAE